MEFDPDAVAHGVLPLDGPYDPDRVCAAAAVVAELVRNLNHATLHRSAFVYPSQVGQVVDSIRGAIGRLDQLFRQVGARLGGFGADPALYADRGGDGQVELARTRDALSDARAAAGGLEAALAAATVALSRLGLRGE